MSKTMGPILAVGTITVVNRTVFHHQPMDWRVPVATGLAAIGFSLGEKVWPQGAEILAWTALLTVLITRTDSRVPSPTESALAYFNATGG